ncbi:hypothetical protein ACLOJK_027689 [Asimina triloba]
MAPMWIYPPFLLSHSQIKTFGLPYNFLVNCGTSSIINMPNAIILSCDQVLDPDNCPLILHNSVYAVVLASPFRASLSSLAYLHGLLLQSGAGFSTGHAHPLLRHVASVSSTTPGLVSTPGWNKVMVVPSFQRRFKGLFFNSTPTGGGRLYSYCHGDDCGGLQIVGAIGEMLVTADFISYLIKLLCRDGHRLHQSVFRKEVINARLLECGMLTEVESRKYARLQVIQQILLRHVS